MCLSFQPASAAFIIAAAGSATRMGQNKIFVPLGDCCAAERVMKTAQGCRCVGSIIVACRAGEEDKFKQMAADNGITKFVGAIAGGKTRQESVSAAMTLVGKDARLVAIHDGARPFVSAGLIEKLCSDAAVFGAAIPFLPINDTVKLRRGGFAAQTADRSQLVTVQTPQVFEIKAYRAALAKANQSGMDYTDDSQLFEAAGKEVFLTEGEQINIKLTRPADLETARMIIETEDKQKL